MNRPLGRHGCKCENNINPLNAKLNLICHLLALLGAHHIIQVSGVRVKANLKDRNKVFMDSSILQQEPFAGCCRYAFVKGVEFTGQPTAWLDLSQDFAPPS